MAAASTNLHDEGLESKGRRKKKTNGKGQEDNTVEQPDYEPFTVVVELVGVAPLLHHRYDPDEVERKSELPKGAKEKKIDNIESFVYRNNDGFLCIPGTNFKAALCNAAKRFKDPSSPRKSAKDLLRAAIAVNPFLAPINRDGEPQETWDAVDRRGVVVQQNRVTRHRPLTLEGWNIQFEVEVLDAEFITPDLIREVIDRAGRYSGLGDYRPDFGRFRVDNFEVIKLV